MRSEIADRILADYKALPWYKKLRGKIRTEWWLIRRLGILKYLGL